MNIENKQDAYNFVKSQGGFAVFDKRGFPFFNQIKSVTQSQNFALKHILLHMLKDIDTMHYIQTYDVKDVLKIFNVQEENKPLSQRANEYKESILKMLVAFLAVEACLSVYNMQEIKEAELDKYSAMKNSYTFYGCCSYLIQILASTCSEVDHGEPLDEEPIVKALWTIYWSLERLFNNEKVSIPWSLIPTVIKQ